MFLEENMKNWTSADITSVSGDSAGMQYSNCHTVLWGHMKYVFSPKFQSNPNSFIHLFEFMFVFYAMLFMP